MADENKGKNHPDDSGIIYCATRKNVDTLHELLRGAGVPAARYHAGMNNEDREAVVHVSCPAGDFTVPLKPLETKIETLA